MYLKLPNPLCNSIERSDQDDFLVYMIGLLLLSGIPQIAPSSRSMPLNKDRGTYYFTAPKDEFPTPDAK